MSLPCTDTSSLTEAARSIILDDPALAAEIVRQTQARRMSMTARQAEAFHYIKDFHRKHGFTPNMGELAEGLGLSAKSGAHRLVVGLEERGYIIRLATKSRCIQIVGDAT